MSDGVTVSGAGGDDDALNFVVSVGVNTAVSECAPVVNDEVIVNAVPLITVTGLPMVVSPSLNWTVPAAAWGFTFAMRVTGKPWGNEPLGAALSVTVVTCTPGEGIGVG